METMVGAVTVRPVDAETPAKLAEIFVVPAVTAVASPLTLIVATPEDDEAHVTSVVRSALLPSV